MMAQATDDDFRSLKICDSNFFDDRMTDGNLSEAIVGMLVGGDGLVENTDKTGSVESNFCSSVQNNVDNTPQWILASTNLQGKNGRGVQHD
jgi:hypothetical protein